MPPLKVFLVDGAENNEVVGLLFGQGLKKVIIDLFWLHWNESKVEMLSRVIKLAEEHLCWVLRDQKCLAGHHVQEESEIESKLAKVETCVISN